MYAWVVGGWVWGGVSLVSVRARLGGGELGVKGGVSSFCACMPVGGGGEWGSLVCVHVCLCGCGGLGVKEGWVSLVSVHACPWRGGGGGAVVKHMCVGDSSVAVVRVWFGSMSVDLGFEVSQDAWPGGFTVESVSVGAFY